MQAERLFMNIQSENWRKIFMAICALMVALGVGQAMASAEVQLYESMVDKNLASMGHGLQMVLKLVFTIIPIASAFIYFLLASLAYRATKHLYQGQLHVIPDFACRTLRLVGWLIIVGHIFPIAQTLNIYRTAFGTGNYAMMNNRLAGFYRMVLASALPALVSSLISIVIGILLIREGKRLSRLDTSLPLPADDAPQA